MDLKKMVSKNTNLTENRNSEIRIWHNWDQCTIHSYVILLFYTQKSVKGCKFPLAKLPIVKWELTIDLQQLSPDIHASHIYPICFPSCFAYVYWHLVFIKTFSLSMLRLNYELGWEKTKVTGFMWHNLVM